jgi:hypothetical protein
LEKYAYGLEQPIGYLYSGEDTASETIQVVGRSGAQRIDRRPTGPSTGGFHRLDIATAAGLEADERLGLLTWRSGGQQRDPLVAELAWLSNHATAFNEQQDRVDVVLEQDFLHEHLNEAVRRAGEDAALLETALATVGRTDLPSDRPTGLTTYLALFLDEPTPGFVPGAHGFVVAATVGNDSGEFSAAVRVGTLQEYHELFDPGGWEKYRTTTASLFGIDPDDVDSVGDGMALSALAPRLGYRMSDLTFRYSSS